jgi:DNA mismatch repair protein MutL
LRPPSLKFIPAPDSRLVRATESISSVAHCLRELLENSIDASSSVITVRLTETGLDTISISDNGCGIPREGLSLLCTEGATSKQFGGRQAGGRGKALEAIASLSFVTIETSADDSGSGFRLQFRENGERMITALPRPRGTSVVVQTLFYPHAVRRRYWLDHKAQSLQEIHEVAAAFALARDIRLSVIVDSKVIVDVGKQSRGHRIRSVLGSTVWKGMIEGCESLEKWNFGSSVEYFTGSATSGSNGRLFLNVNERPCSNANMGRAIKQEFKLCAGPKMPTVLLWLTVPETGFTFLADEPLIGVSFLNESALQTEICAMLRRAWRSTAETLSIPRTFGLDALPDSPPLVTPPLSRPRVVPSHTPAKTVTPCVQWRLNTDQIACQFRLARSWNDDLGGPRTSITSKSFSEMEVIGQWNRSFIITRLGSDVYAIDQHAACEAANFEKFRRSDGCERQRLLQPIRIRISPDERENAVQHQQHLSDLGFEYEILDDAVQLLTMPSGETVARGSADFHELLGLVHDVPNSPVMTAAARSQLAYHACHASVRAGDAMSHSQIRGLLTRMANSDYPWNCQHGRPTWCCIHRLTDCTSFSPIGGEG